MIEETFEIKVNNHNIVLNIVSVNDSKSVTVCIKAFYKTVINGQINFGKYANEHLVKYYPKKKLKLILNQIDTINEWKSQYKIFSKR